MRHILTKTDTFVVVALLLFLTTSTLYSQKRTYKIELPEGATARLGRGSIHDLKYSMDGTRIAVATSMGIWVYDTTELNEIYLLRKNSRRMFFSTFSPDSETLVSASLSGLYIWDINTGELQRQLENDSLAANMNFSRDGSTFWNVNLDGSMLIWDTNTWKAKHEFRDFLDPEQVNPWRVSINPSNFVVASSNDKGIVSIYDPFSGESKEMSKLNVEELVYSLTFNHDGSLLASRSNSEVRILHPETAELRQKIDIVPVGGRIEFSPDGNLIANYTYAGDMQLYDVKTGKKYRSYDQHTAFINTVDFSSDMRTLASASDDGSMRIWNVFNGEQIHAIYDHFGYFRCMDVSPDGKTVVAAGGDLNVSLWDVATGKTVNSFYKVINPVNAVSFDTTGSMIAVAFISNRSIIGLWDSKTGQQVERLEGHEGQIDSVVFSPDGKMIVSGSTDNTVRIWDVKTSSVKHVLNGHEEDVTSVDFSPDGTTIASGSTDQRIILWDANTGEEKHVLAGHETDVASLSFSPDGTKIASVALSSEVFLWSVGPGELDKVIHAGKSIVSSVVFHHKGKVIAIGRDTGDVELIDVESEMSLHKFSGHLTQITHLAFASDGNKLVSLSDDGVMFVWDVAGVVNR